MVEGLLGREHEIDQLDAALAGATEHGGASLITGDAGIGKTSLLGHVVTQARARGDRVLAITGFESEAELPYAGLHQLLQPILDAAEALPAPQRAALLTALGMEAGAPPEMFLVALATLNMLDTVSEDRSLVVVADDVQWVDAPTASILTFVARRLESTRVLLVAALRAGYRSPVRSAHLTEIEVGPLSEEASTALLVSIAPELDRHVRRLILDEAAGNPLALVELPRGRSNGDAGTLRLTDRLERTFSAQSARLPAATQTALLIAALDSEPSVGDVMDATHRRVGAEVTVDVLQPALEAGLISIDASVVRFRHPLIRSALEQSATAVQRRDAHRLLAEVITDPDRRAWHRAKSVLGADEGAAADLAAVAARAQVRGATSTALGALELAASLTPDEADRARRLLEGAELAFQLGDRAAVTRLLDSAATVRVSAHDIARMTWLREIFNDGVPGDPDAVARLATLAGDAAARGDRSLALNLLQAAALRCWWADPGPEAKDLVVAAVGHIAGDEPEPLALEILSLTAPPDTAERLISRVRHAAEVDLGDPARAQLLAFAAYVAGDVALAIELMDRAAPTLRAQGRLGLLAQLLVLRSWAAINTGQFGDALRAVEEGSELALETEQPIWAAISRLGRAALAGLQGDEDSARMLIAGAGELMGSLSMPLIRAKAEFARGVTAMTAGRNADAFDHLSAMLQAGGPAFHARVAQAAAPLVIECAVRAGRTDDAQRVMETLEAMAARTRAPLLQIGVRTGRALLAADAEAESLYRDALAAEPQWPFDHARMQMSYGVWLRRQRRIIESRPPLRGARDGFEALGLPVWADKARAELRATGERGAEPARAPRIPLTPQELQIAQMAASGLSNREIGDRLFLSHRTVGAHLYRVFPKLGVASRSELATALAR